MTEKRIMVRRGINGRNEWYLCQMFGYKEIGRQIDNIDTDKPNSEQDPIAIFMEY